MPEENPYLQRSRDFWKVAATFPTDKESVYPKHAEAHGFEEARGKRVLEYGCGGGSDAESFCRRGALVWYADIVPTNVEHTKTRLTAAGYGKRSFPVELTDSADLNAVPVMDVVSSHGVLHHIKDPDPVLDAFVSVLLKNGRLFVMLYTEELWRLCSSAIADRVEKLGITPEEAFAWSTDGSGCPYARAYTEAEGRRLIERHGFRVDAVVVYNNGDFRTFQATKVC